MYGWYGLHVNFIFNGIVCHFILVTSCALNFHIQCFAHCFSSVIQTTFIVILCRDCFEEGGENQSTPPLTTKRSLNAEDKPISQPTFNVNSKLPPTHPNRNQSRNHSGHLNTNQGSHGHSGRSVEAGLRIGEAGKVTYPYYYLHCRMTLVQLIVFHSIRLFLKVQSIQFKGVLLPARGCSLLN